jgi:hypothetical protein
MKNANVSLVVMLLIASASTQSAWSKPPVKKALAPKSDVVVTKNPDGTVEASDADDSAAPAASPTARPGVTYRPAPPGVLHYADGVVVHRNADGSVEVSDEESMHPTMHSLGSPTSSAAVKHHATTHSGTKKTTAHPKTK